MKTIKRFAFGLLNAFHRYLKATVVPLLAFIVLLAVGPSLIPILVDRVFSWQRSDWVGSIWGLLLLAILFSWAKRTWAATFYHEVRREMAPQASAKLKFPGKGIPKHLHEAWFKASSLVDSDGSTFADWVIAKSEPDSTAEQVLDLAREMRRHWSTPESASDPIDVAHHEAGHAVVAHALGCTVLSATITPTEQFNGHAAYATPFPTVPEHDSMFIRMAASLGGNVVDLYRGVHNTGSVSDLESAHRQALSIISIGKPPLGFRGPLETDALVAGARSLAAAIIEENRDVVDLLARDLVEAKTLGNQEMRAVLGRVGWSGFRRVAPRVRPDRQHSR